MWMCGVEGEETGQSPRLGLSLLMWPVSLDHKLHQNLSVFPSRSPGPAPPLRWDRMARMSWSWVFSFSGQLGSEKAPAG